MNNDSAIFRTLSSSIVLFPQIHTITSHVKTTSDKFQEKVVILQCNWSVFIKTVKVIKSKECYKKRAKSRAA